jgi:23S rRNA pseudouridine2605 synthase
MRLARFLARAGESSRRGAADLVAAGRVRINNRAPLGPGDPVDPGRDSVSVDGRVVRVAPAAWLALHKPPGLVTSKRASARHPSVFGLVGGFPGVVAVGRLDVMSEGLLLFTTDGELAARLMHPRWQVPRRYRVSVTGPLTREARAQLERGTDLGDDGRPARPLSLSFEPGRNGGTLELELAEGRNRVVRRMCAAAGLGIRRLVRTSYGPVELGTLGTGRTRQLMRRERDALYRAVDLPPPDLHT